MYFNFTAENIVLNSKNLLVHSTLSIPVVDISLVTICTAMSTLNGSLTVTSTCNVPIFSLMLYED